MTAGLIVLVYAIVKAEDFGWGSGRTLGLAASAFALLGAFVLIESRTRARLIRLGIFTVRSLAGANGVLLIVMGGLLGFFCFSTLYIRLILGYSPLEAGLAFLPMTVGIGIGAGIAQQLVKRLADKTTSVLADLGRPPSQADRADALLDGFQVAFTAATILVAVGAVVLMLVVRRRDVANVNPGAAPIPTA